MTSLFDLVGLEVAVPLGSFLVLALFGKRLPHLVVALFGAGSVGVAAVIAAIVGVRFILGPPSTGAYIQLLWTWMQAGTFEAKIAFYVDPLAVVMMLIVTWVGFFIHLYSTEFMAEEEGYSRYFAYMNLFVASMLILVLADNLLLLYLGWEGVGLCSFLLIGFWYRDPANAVAARKAFIVTRVGDASFAVALLLLFTQLGTLEIQELMARAIDQWPIGSAAVVATCFLLLGGAVGKSAQLPLQTWLPDAMAGPSPVSALIHAATMVTAGVYLIARTHVLFERAPGAMLAVAIVGALTLLLSGFSGLVQWDIKRVLAYSTISQIGYMFLGLGVGAWSSAIFHLMVHAFFKSLLFLGAGAVIHAMHHEHDIRKMGGLRHEMPVTFWTFLIAGGALAGIPLVTSGFYSKDNIIAQAWFSQHGGWPLWAAGLVGVLLTSLYTFRMIFIAFFGEQRSPVEKRPGIAMKIPLVVLAFLSLVAGVAGVPKTLGGGFQPLLSFLDRALPPATGMPAEPFGVEGALEAASGTVSLLGLLAAYWWFIRRRERVPEAYEVPFAPPLIRRWWFVDWGFDWLYDLLFVRPYVWFAKIDRDDFIDSAYRGLMRLVSFSHLLVRRSQNGMVRWYVTGIAFGTVIILALVALFY